MAWKQQKFWKLVGVGSYLSFLLMGVAVSEPLVQGRPVTVLLFWSTECPVAEAATRELNELVREFKNRNVMFEAIFSNQGESQETASSMLRRRGHDFSWSLDPGGARAQKYGVKRVPTVVVFDDRGEMAYIGPLASKSMGQAPKQRYAWEAIQAVAEGKVPKYASVEPEGCLIQLPVRDGDSQEIRQMVTYGSDVRPLVKRHCLPCHGPTGAAPMRFDRYIDVRRWAPMMVEVLHSGKMPPVRGGEATDPHDLRSVLMTWIEKGRPGGSWEEEKPVAAVVESIKLRTLVVAAADSGTVIKQSWISTGISTGGMVVQFSHPRSIRTLDIFRDSKVGEEWVAHWRAGSIGWSKGSKMGERLRLEWRVVNHLSAIWGTPFLQVSGSIPLPSVGRRQVVRSEKVDVTAGHMSSLAKMRFDPAVSGRLLGWRLLGLADTVEGFAFVATMDGREVPLITGRVAGDAWPVLNPCNYDLQLGDRLIVVGSRMGGPEAITAELNRPKVVLELNIVGGAIGSEDFVRTVTYLGQR